LQTSQGYIIRILQHFATKLWNITNFVMLFQAMMEFCLDLLRSKFWLIGEWSISTPGILFDSIFGKNVYIQSLGQNELVSHNDKRELFCGAQQNGGTMEQLYSATRILAHTFATKIMAHTCFLYTVVNIEFLKSRVWYEISKLFKQ
jgi:hypothetical protein